MGLGRSELKDKSEAVMMTSKMKETEKRRILKNIILISVAFLLNFNAFQGLSRLQSSMHIDQGLGVIMLSVIYGTLVLSCLFVPKSLISFLGHKWTMAISFCGYTLWMAANGYAVWWTMITTSVLVGLCAAPLWTAQCSYFTIVAQRYAELSNESVDGVVTRFFGIFFMFFQCSSITGSIVSSMTLSPSNATYSDGSDVRAYCGINDCPWSNVTNTNLTKPDDNAIWIMLGIYIGIALLAILVISAFVDKLPPELSARRTGVWGEVLEQAMATVKHCIKNTEQIFLIPLTVYSGFEQAFYSAEFSKSFVSCSLGIWKVGLVTLPYGIVNALTSFATGQIVQYTGRIPMFVAAVVVDLSLQFTLMFWVPVQAEEYVLYLLAAMWGFSDAIWQTQINGMYGAVFPKSSEAAFSNYKTWESLGFIVAFAYSSLLCTSVKLYILTSMLLLGITGLVIVEWMIRKNRTDPGVNTKEPQHPESELESSVGEGALQRLRNQQTMDNDAL